MMNRHRVSLSLLVVLSTTILVAPIFVSAQEQSPESLGLSSERLERVAELMQRHIEERTFSGAVTLIARSTLLSEGSFGWSGAFNTHFFIDLEERLVAIFMTQSAFLETRQQLREDFETAVMQALIDDPVR
jgi:hypothetical protein